MTDTRSDLDASDGHVATRKQHRPPPKLTWATVWEWCDRHAAIVILLGAGLAALLFLLNLPLSPDFNIDETFYARAGQNISNYNSVSFATDPVVVHPPLFFITVAGWLHLTGDTHSAVLSAIHAGRYLNVIFNVGIVVMSAVLCREWTTRRSSAARGRALVSVLLLVALSALLLRFGRLLLMEPMAVFLSLVTLWLAWRMRASTDWLYITVVGGAVGTTLLVKETAIFVLFAPIVSSLVRLEGRAVWRYISAFALGCVIWLTFPLWEWRNGDWSSFYTTQTVSLRRLVGLVQVTGLNRPHVSPLLALEGTFWDFVGSYLTYAIGGFVLLVALRRLIRMRRSAFDEGTAQIIGMGATGYVFLVYSLSVGLANEQLTVYSVPAAALLVASYSEIRMQPRKATRRRIDLTRVVAVLTVTVVIIGVVNWSRIFAFGRDDGTARMEAFIRDNVPVCVPINSTGDFNHWTETLRTNPITTFSAGPTAVLFGVHLFLLSPKDVEFLYGNSTPELEHWVEANGKLLYKVPSHTSDEISLWQVGTPTVSTGVSLPSCVGSLGVPDKNNIASATRFLSYYGIALGLDLLAILGGWIWLRRNKAASPAPESAGHDD